MANNCIIDNCGKPVHGHNLCRKHYADNYRERNRLRLRAQSAQYYLENKEKCIKASRRWEAKCKSDGMDRHAMYRERNRLALAERMKQWNKNNQERRQLIRKKYRTDNLAFHAYLSMKRYAIKLHATPKWANQFLIKEVYRLAELRTQITGIKWNVDHIIPLQSDRVCGLHVENNLRVIPKSDNIAKGNRYWPDMPNYEDGRSESYKPRAFGLI